MQKWHNLSNSFALCTTTISFNSKHIVFYVLPTVHFHLILANYGKSFSIHSSEIQGAVRVHTRVYFLFPPMKTDDNVLEKVAAAPISTSVFRRADGDS